MAFSDRPFVTIVMPSLDEERYIASAIASIIPDEDSDFDYEILVADGGSRDKTRKIIDLLSRGPSTIRWIDNPGRSQATGMNMAARVADARATILVRADCHAHYPPRFVETCMKELKSSGSASVVVPMRTVGATCMQSAIAAAQNSRLGNGGAAHRRPGHGSRYVDHGHHAAFDRQLFLELGGYDESFLANEDAEFDVRLLASGRKIWMSDAGAISYFPRSTLFSLARQYFKYGVGRASTLQKQGGTLKPRQALPIVAFVGCFLSLLSAFYDMNCAVVALLYAGLCLCWGGTMATLQRMPCSALAGFAAMTMHMAWALGFLLAMSRALLNRSGVGAVSLGEQARSGGRR